MSFEAAMQKVISGNKPTNDNAIVMNMYNDMIEFMHKVSTNDIGNINTYFTKMYSSFIVFESSLKIKIEVSKNISTVADPIRTTVYIANCIRELTKDGRTININDQKDIDKLVHIVDALYSLSKYYNLTWNRI